MPNRSDIPSSAITEHIDGNSSSDQQESHQTGGIEETHNVAMPVVVRHFNWTFVFVAQRSHARISTRAIPQEK